MRLEPSTCDWSDNYPSTSIPFGKNPFGTSGVRVVWDIFFKLITLLGISDYMYAYPIPKPTVGTEIRSGEPITSYLKSD